MYQLQEPEQLSTSRFVLSTGKDLQTTPHLQNNETLDDHAIPSYATMSANAGRVSKKSSPPSHQTLLFLRFKKNQGMSSRCRVTSMYLSRESEKKMRKA